MNGSALVAFDESGNTGDNLLDEAQPIFCLASIHADEAAAAEVVSNLLPHGRAELHFAGLRGSAVGRAVVLAALESEIFQPGSARVTPMHKPFAIVARLFDYIIEPTLFERGTDVLDAGMQLDFVNVLYRRGPTACGEDRWREMLEAFVALMREQNDATLDRFMAAHAACRLAAGNLLVRFILDDVPDRDEVANRVRIDQPAGVGARDLLDPAATSLMENCITWPSRLGRPITVLHDETTVIRRWRVLLETLAGPEAAATVGPYWAARMPLPLQISEILLVRSHDVPLVQLADLLAGAAVTWLTETLFPGGQWATFAAQLGDTRLPDLIENEVWPMPVTTFGRFA